MFPRRPGSRVAVGRQVRPSSTLTGTGTSTFSSPVTWNGRSPRTRGAASASPGTGRTATRSTSLRSRISCTGTAATGHSRMSRTPAESEARPGRASASRSPISTGTAGQTCLWRTIRSLSSSSETLRGQASRRSRSCQAWRTTRTAGHLRAWERTWATTTTMATRTCSSTHWPTSAMRCSATTARCSSMSPDRRA